MKQALLDRFTLTLISIGLVTGCTGVFLFVDLYRSQQDSRQNYTSAVRGLDLIGEVQYQAQESRRTLLYALSTTDSNLQVDYADQSRAAETLVTESLVEYEKLAVKREGAAEGRHVSARWGSYLEVRDQLIALMLEGDPKAAVARDLKEGVPAFNALRKDLEEAKAQLRKGSDQLLQKLDASFQRSLVRMAGILSMLVVLGVVSAKTMQDRTLLGELRESETRLRADFARAQQEESATAERLSAVLRAATGYSIIGTDPAGLITVFNHGAERMLGYSAAEVIGSQTPCIIHDDAEVAERAEKLDMEPGFEVMVAAARRGQTETREWTYLRKGGERFPVSLAVSALHDGRGELAGFIGIAEDISERKANEEALRQSQQKLLESSRLAGMAEVATSVLHNVGNVLNSVNVSGNVISERLHNSKIAVLAKATDLINEHRSDFGEFVTSDPRGKRIPELISTLSTALREEHNEMLAEVGVITKHIGHIKEIVAMQQSYARVGGVIEQLEVEDLVSDALRMNAASMSRHQVKVLQEYEKVPKVQVDRHKVLQILVNLLSNAKHAVDDSGRADKQVTVKIQNNGGEFVKVSIQDNGIGIDPDNLTRIFSHGFTTKKTGHGFGLHSGALAASEAGGALSVHSEGRGTGATFTLALPIKAPSGPARENSTQPQTEHEI